MKKILLVIAVVFSLTGAGHSQGLPNSFSISFSGEGWGWHYATGTYEQYDMDPEVKQRLSDFNYPLVDGSPIYRIVNPFPPLDESWGEVMVYAVHTEYGWMLIDDDITEGVAPFMSPPRGDQQMEMIDGIPSFSSGYGFSVMVIDVNNSVFVEQAEKLNEGLEFSDGQWRVK
jgi:hypothetical protein